MITYEITQIDWDTEGQLIEDLPDSILLETDEEMDQYDISDWLSDEYGWCVDNFMFNVLENNSL